jgi:hypothetical protein
MTVLVYTPTYGDGPRPETLESVSQQTFTDYEYEIGWHNPFPGEKMKNVLAQYQRAREMVLEGGYDALLTFEHDMTMLPDTLQKLYNTDALVTFATYMLRHGTPCLNAWQYVNDRNLGMSLSLYPKELKKLQAKGQGRVSGVGWGCTLIRRQVLERIPITASSETDAGDMTFATNCLHAGIEMIARFDVRCGHYHADGTLLEIGKNGGAVSRVLALQTVNANVGGQSLAMKKGRYYSIPPEVASELARAGYVQVTNDDDSQQEIGEREQPDISGREMAVNPKVATRKTRKGK